MNLGRQIGNLMKWNVYLKVWSLNICQIIESHNLKIYIEINNYAMLSYS